MPIFSECEARLKVEQICFTEQNLPGLLAAREKSSTDAHVQRLMRKLHAGWGLMHYCH